MRASCWSILAVAACATTPPPAPSSAAAPGPSTPEEAEVAARAEAFFRAIDTRDVAAFRGAAAASFVLLDSGRSFDVDVLAKQLEGRIARAAPVRSRTCETPRIRRGASSVVYIAECNEKTPAHGEMPASEVDGANTLVWVREGDAWKVALWQWNVGGTEGERAHWNTMYKGAVAFRRAPNRHLIESVAGVTPGTALDVAMGEGRNALYLASVGWKVTGVDFSDEAIRLAREQAAAKRLALDAVLQDIERYDFGTARWDLVTLIYAGSDPKLIDRIKTGIKPGGRLVVEFFHKEVTANVGIGGFEAGELAKQLAGWKIVTDVVVEDIADWGLRKTKLVRFTAQKP